MVDSDSEYSGDDYYGVGENLQDKCKALKKEIKYLRKKVCDLQGFSEGTSLSKVREMYNEAQKRLMSAPNDVSVSNEFDRLAKGLYSHPEYRKEQEEMQRKWDEELMALAEVALYRMRKLIHPDVANMTEQNIIDNGIPKECAHRLKSRPLFLIVTHRETFNTMHSVTLNKCSNQGLDIVEMLAIYARLPKTFPNDGDGKKAEWRANFVQTLQVLVNKKKNGNLSRDEKRHHAYNDAEFELNQREELIRQEDENSEEKTEEKKPYYYDPMLPLIPPPPVEKSTAFQPTKPPDFLPNKGQKVTVTKENGATARPSEPPNQMMAMLNELQTTRTKMMSHKKSSGKIVIK